MQTPEGHIQTCIDVWLQEYSGEVRIQVKSAEVGNSKLGASRIIINATYHPDITICLNDAQLARLGEAVNGRLAEIAERKAKTCPVCGVNEGAARGLPCPTCYGKLSEAERAEYGLQEPEAEAAEVG